MSRFILYHNVSHTSGSINSFIDSLLYHSLTIWHHAQIGITPSFFEFCITHKSGCTPLFRQFGMSHKSGLSLYFDNLACCTNPACCLYFKHLVHIKRFCHVLVYLLYRIVLYLSHLYLVLSYLDNSALRTNIYFWEFCIAYRYLYCNLALRTDICFVLQSGIAHRYLFCIAIWHRA